MVQVKEKLTATVNGYGVIETENMEALSTILNTIGGYLVHSVGNEGREVTFKAFGRKDYVAKLVSKRYGYPEDGLIWNCQLVTNK